jgi:hypothetical protein
VNLKSLAALLLLAAALPAAAQRHRFWRVMSDD